MGQAVLRESVLPAARGSAGSQGAGKRASLGYEPLARDAKRAAAWRGRGRRWQQRCESGGRVPRPKAASLAKTMAAVTPMKPKKGADGGQFSDMASERPI